MNIKKYGFHSLDMSENTDNIWARVTAVHRNLFEVICEYGTGFARLQTGKFHTGASLVPTTGDFVLLRWQAQGESRIVKTMERKTYLSRLDPSSSGCKEQAVAANFDYVFIVQSLDRDFNLRRLERYLTLAWQSGASPVIVLTKADHSDDIFTHILAAEKLAIGVDVIAVSAKTGYGLDKLTAYLQPGKTIVFLGSSGVGKSTLINTLAGEEVMAAGSIREKDGRGRHTTSRRQLILLKSGVMVIDTPGMRELGMWEVSEGLGQSFSDIEQYFGQCRFNDCRHQTEPGCAVRGAIERGELSPQRFESYLKLNSEAQYANDKTGYLRGKQRRFKNIAKIQRARKETDYRHTPCTETFFCEVCGELIVPEDAGSRHRNHCPSCLSSVHADNRPGDRASSCRGIMEPAAVWVRKNGEWAIIHRCRSCGTFSSNRIAADDNASLLMSIAMRPLNKLPGQRAKLPPAPGRSGKIIPKQDVFTCKLCQKPVKSKEKGRQNAHCRHCLSGIHIDDLPGDRASLCKGLMDPIAIWIRENGQWEIIHRCRSCGIVRSSPVKAEDNMTLLLSVAMKPLAEPPFPLWQLEGY